MEMDNYQIDQEKLSNDRVETSTKRIAHALNLIEAANQELKWACESQKWNDDICFEIDDAAAKLGYCLATLVRWNDEDTDVSEV